MEGDHSMGFSSSKIVYKSNNVKIRRLIEGTLMDSIPTIDGYKSFSKEDPINLKSIVNQARLTHLIRQKKKQPCNPNPPENVIPQNDPLTYLLMTLLPKMKKED